MPGSGAGALRKKDRVRRRTAPFEIGAATSTPRGRAAIRRRLWLAALSRLQVPPMSPSTPGPSQRRAGFLAALGAYVSWGMFPLFFKALRHVPAFEILAHRVVWSAVFLIVLIVVTGRARELRGAFPKGTRAMYLVSTLLIAANWLVFIWAVNAGHVLEASLGYFINPLVNVLLGVVFLGEALTRRQLAAVLLAALGVVALVLRVGHVPWISLSLAATFGLYGLVRKRAHIPPVTGLLVETLVLAPVALAYLVALGVAGHGAFGSTTATTALLASAGVVTAVPLIWFAMGVRSLRYSTMGLVQYVTPTGQFLLAVALYREPFTTAHAIAFGCIWLSLALYSYDALSSPSAAPSPEPAD
jgi:chloramphenicol-sensitive protein RarD